MKGAVYKLFASKAVLLLALYCLPAGLWGQTGQAADSLVIPDNLPRTSLFPEKSYRINQQIKVFFDGHNPKTATWLGFVPGLGQIYNKKYWKLPIVYAGFAVTGYFAISNRNNYRLFEDAYVCKLNEDPDDPDSFCDNELAQKYTLDGLKANRDYYRRNMELSFVIMGLWYILQILDSTVDAHLYDWNVDDNLSLRLEPVVSPAAFSGNRQSLPLPGTPPVTGLTLTFGF